jgi:hypothetical protein
MSAFDPYNWWKRGVKVTTPLRKSPKGSPDPLVWHQIQHGDFRPSPYWKMSEAEVSLWEKEVKDYRRKNPRVTEESIQEFAENRWRTYRRRIEKLKESHLQYEISRIEMLKQGLIEAFGIDIWEEMIEKCDGDETTLYHQYKIESLKRKGETK